MVFSGYNERGIIAFCRFCKRYDIPFFIVAAHQNDKILLSSYRHNLLDIRRSPDLALEDFQRYRSMLSTKLSKDEIVVLPSTEFLNRFLLQEKKSLESLGYIIPICSKEIYEAVSDKYSFYCLCKEYGISVPQELEPHSNLLPPFVVKPKTYFAPGSMKVNPKPILVKHVESKEFVRDLLISREVFIQEFIEGRSIYLLFYFGKNGFYRVYSQENFIQQSNGRSIIAARSSSFHESQEIKPFVTLFQKLGFHGLVMVEVRYQEGKSYMIEANPRIWGPSQLINDAGMDLFALWTKDLGLIKDFSPQIYQPEIEYFWSGGLVEDTSSQKDIAFHNYSKERFLDEYAKWIRNEVYLREDTLGIFLEELRRK